MDWLFLQNLQSRCLAWKNGGTWRSPTTALSDSCRTCRRRYSGSKSDLSAGESMSQCCGTCGIVIARLDSSPSFSKSSLLPPCKDYSSSANIEIMWAKRESKSGLLTVFAAAECQVQIMDNFWSFHIASLFLKVYCNIYHHICNRHGDNCQCRER